MPNPTQVGIVQSMTAAPAAARSSIAVSATNSATPIDVPDCCIYLKSGHFYLFELLAVVFTSVTAGARIKFSVPNGHQVEYSSYHHPELGVITGGEVAITTGWDLSAIQHVRLSGHVETFNAPAGFFQLQMAQAVADAGTTSVFSDATIIAWEFPENGLTQ